MNVQCTQAGEAHHVPGQSVLCTRPWSGGGRVCHATPQGRGWWPVGGDGRGPASEAPCGGRNPSKPGLDSDLEAFSHNPTDSSFAPLALSQAQTPSFSFCFKVYFSPKIMFSISPISFTFHMHEISFSILLLSFFCVTLALK